MSQRPATATSDHVARAMHLAALPDRPRAIAELERLVRQHPDDGRLRHVLGVTLLEAGRAAEAVPVLAPLARALDGASPMARVHFANALADAGEPARAAEVLVRHVARDPSPDAWYALGRAQQLAGHPHEALEAYTHLVQLAPTHVGGWANLATAAFFAGDLSRAETAARRALMLDPSHADAQLNRAIALLARREWREGWAAYEARWRTAAMARQRTASAAPRWDGAPLAGPLVVVSEQGLGDTVQGVRWLRAARARAGRVILVVPAPLVRWLQASGLADAVLAHGEPLPPHAAQVPLWSLPHVLGLHTDAAVHGDGAPYLPGERRAGAWPPQRIGLAWSGSATHLNDRHRSMSVATLAPLLAIPHVTWVSLQVDQRGALARAASAAGVPSAAVEEPLAAGADFAETAQVLGTLDLVIAVDSAVAHAAGALGVPTWVLLPRVGLDWRWTEAEATTPWYRTMRPWRQPAAGDWATLVRDLVPALSARVSSAADGAAHARAGRWPEAYAALREAATERPRDAAVQVNLSTAALKCRQYLEADRASTAAIALAPQSADAWVARANALVAAGAEDDAVAAAERAAALAPHDEIVQRTLARTLERGDRLEASLERYDALLRGREADAVLRYHRALVLLKLGRWREGWREYEWRWGTTTFAAWRRAWPALPAWDGRSRPGLRLVVRHEQGAGDTIMAARWLPQLTALGCAVTAQVPPALVPLLAGQFDGVQVVSTQTPVAGDAIVAMLSMPALLGLDAPEPGPSYLRAPHDALTRAAALAATPRPRLGLAWAGEPSHPFDHLRSRALASFDAVRAAQPGTWVSLQVGARRDDLARDRRHPPMLDAGAVVRDFADTAAWVTQLDQVVTVDTSVAHLAGALGVATTITLPASADWRWGRAGNRSAWYASVRLIRAARAGPHRSTGAALAPEPVTAP